VVFRRQNLITGVEGHYQTYSRYIERASAGHSLPKVARTAVLSRPWLPGGREQSRFP